MTHSRNIWFIHSLIYQLIKMSDSRACSTGVSYYIVVLVSRITIRIPYKDIKRPRSTTKPMQVVDHISIHWDLLIPIKEKRSISACFVPVITVIGLKWLVKNWTGNTCSPGPRPRIYFSQNCSPLVCKFVQFSDTFSLHLEEWML